VPRSGVSASAALAREASAIQTSRSVPLPPLPSLWEGHARDPAWDCNIFESPRGFRNVFSSTHNPTTSSQARSITPPRRISRSGGGPRGDQPKGNMPHALTPEPTSQETTASRRPKARRQRERKAAERQQFKATKQGLAYRIQTGTHPRNWTQKGTTTTQKGNRQKNRRSNSQPTCAAF